MGHRGGEYPSIVDNDDGNYDGDNDHRRRRLLFFYLVNFIRLFLFNCHDLCICIYLKYMTNISERYVLSLKNNNNNKR